jgi:surface antigen
MMRISSILLSLHRAPQFVWRTAKAMTPLCLVILVLHACSLTEKVPEGEQLYTGIKSVTYHLPSAKAKRGQPSKATADSAGVITSIANAVEAIDRAVNGGAKLQTSMSELEQRDKKSLNTAERKLLEHKESQAKENLEAMRTEIEAVLAYAPNGALFGSSKYVSPWKPGLWAYNTFVDAETWVGKWLFKAFAEPPVLISTVAPQMRTKVAATTLRNYGYLRGKVDYNVLTSSNPLKAKLSYDVTPGLLFYLDSIEYRHFDPVADSLLSRTRHKSLLRRGNPFSIAQLSGEQSRIEALMRNNGYYFYTAATTTFQADTVRQTGYVDLRVQPNPNRAANTRRPWHMGHTYVVIRDNQDSPLTGQLKREGYTYFFPGKKIPLRSGLWRRSVSHIEGERFALYDQKSTQEQLYALGLFSSLDIEYYPRDTTATCDTLDMRINATLGYPFESGLEMNATLKSNDQAGPGISYELSRLNAFRGAETVAWKIFGSYEWQIGKGASSNNNSFELGTQLSFKFPRLMMPWFNPSAMGRRARRALKLARAEAAANGLPAPLRLSDVLPLNGTTTFALNADWRNRSSFFQFVTFGGNMTYKWSRSSNVRHELSPITIEYNSTLNKTAVFDSITRANPALYISMRNQFVPSISYLFTYSSPASVRHPFWLQLFVKEAGNVTSGLYALAGKPFSQTDKEMLGSPFAQFVKATAEMHYTHRITDRFSVATRAFAGAVYSYGNSTRAPFGDQFYVGGANSVRAFGVRTIGPGGYNAPHTNYSYIDQTGDFKLEANAELRAHLFGSLHGAIFLDAGNVWLMRPDAQRPQSELNLSNLRRVAVGTGLGLRYDMQFLVLRFDLGIGLHAPYQTQRSGFYNMNSFRESLAFHFAIGYPF